MTRVTRSCIETAPAGSRLLGGSRKARMLRSLRGWFKKAVSTGLAIGRSQKEGRGRFLTARFKDPRASNALGFRLRRDLAYRLYLPSGSSRRDTLPLIVMLHGCKQNALIFANGTRMNALAEEYRCAVLYPEQSKHSNPLRCWNWFESASLAGQGEAELIARLIEQVAERRPIDTRRVYVVGMSAGGAMACLLGVRHSRLFAACAVHSGLMYGAASSSMQALAAMRSGPSASSIAEARRVACVAGESEFMVPTLVIHGDGDTTVNPANADRIIEQLKARAETVDPGPFSAAPERRFEAGGRSYRQQDYSQRGRIVLCKVLVEGLGHAWSGGDSRYEFNEAGGPDATRLILDFVMQYGRRTAWESGVAMIMRTGEG
jgi:poly(hydroxyalkanoate) depolymerase family esterase